MSTALVGDPIQVPIGQLTTLRITLSPTVDVTGWAGAVLTIREDPLYPRRTVQRKAGDVDVSGWDVALTSTTFSIVDAEAGIIDVSIPAADAALLEAGERRYMLDVWRTDADWLIYGPVWVSVPPRVRVPS